MNGAAAPAAHIISGITQHKQMNALLCGPGALEIVYDYWGADINQKAIADVARTSYAGTYTWDVARAGHFSELSAAEGKFFPHAAPSAGFLERSTGYSSFNYSSNDFWWDDLKALVASDIPVILLMRYAPADDAGHYRVIVGYNEEKEVVYFLDPWARDQKKKTNPDGTVTWTMANFEKAWNYDKYGTQHPYWGAVIMPWSVNLHTDGEIIPGSVINVTADITYPCPRPFNCEAFPATGATAQIILPDSMHVYSSSSAEIGDLSAGESVSVTWNVMIDGIPDGSSIAVKADGLISGAVPDVFLPGISYPSYNYSDRIGGEGIIQLFPDGKIS